jgi:D-lactate dehydrogenase
MLRINTSNDGKSVACAPLQAAFYEVFAEEERELRKCLKGVAASFTPLTIQEAGEAAPPAPVVSIRTQSVIPRSWAPRLRGIIARATGYDHLLAYRRATGVAVPAAYLPDYAARAVAEQALLLWAALLRRLPEQRQAVAKFARDGLTGCELRNRRLTVVGVGRIGGEIVDLGFGLGMDVAGVDLVERPQLKSKYGLKYLPLAKGIARAEVLAVALPLTKLTAGLLDYAKLKRLPRGAVLVNVGRGETTPPADLLRLLETDILGGVGLDVFDREPELAGVLRDGKRTASLPQTVRASVAATLRLMRHPRAICTPHNAFNTAEAVARKAQGAAANLRRFIAVGKFLTPVPG